ncbi:hypothetical protein [Candidatus Methylomirabilis sp.]|uniref:hypothetical protein n=1 Tax=Candidatus Methylomirabilis sp. TaxID=2032687 RepID=UPI003C78F4CE
MGHRDQKGGGETMTLNRTQRVILGVGGCLLLVTLLYVPWVYTVDAGGGVHLQRNAGYRLLFQPPNPYGAVRIGMVYEVGERFVIVKIDTTRVLLQLAAIVTGTALLMFLFSHRNLFTQSLPEKTSERGILERLRSPMDPRLFWLLLALFLGLLAFLGKTSNP